MYENRRDSTRAVQCQSVRRRLQCGYATDVTKRIISLQLEPGTHWVTIYVNSHEKQAKYFDPMGRELCETLQTYLYRWCNDGCTTNANCRVSLVSCVDIIVFTFACLEIKE